MSETPLQPLVILADDLTGAADAAAHAYAAGLPARVLLTGSSTDGQFAGAPALNSASRGLAAHEAGAVVAQIARGHAGALWVKKIDSMMRGNVVAEVRALAAALGRPVVLLTPALPHMGRVVRGGLLWLGPESSPIVLRRRLRARVQTVGLEVVRSAERLAAEIVAAAQGASPAAPALLLADAENEADLRALAAAALDHPAHALLAGSGAAVGALAAELVKRRAEPAAPVAHAAWAGARALVVIGSGSERAREQVVAAAALPGVAWIEAAEATPLAGFPECRSLILTAPRVEQGRLSAAPAHFLARDAATALRAGSFTRVVVGGGATAEALLARLAIGAFDVTALAAVGMPLLTPRGEWMGSAPGFVLKAGNHGAVGLLARWLCDSGAPDECV